MRRTGPRSPSSRSSSRPPADTDGDGLPDLWEQQFGLDPNSAVGEHGADGDPDGDGVNNLAEYQNGTHPRGFVTRYFAEGATGTFFDTTFALLNLNPTTTAGVLLRFQKGDGTNLSHHLQIGALRRATVRVDALPGMSSAEFSTVVESDRDLAADRTMTWDTSGYGSHAEASVPAPATTWYLAEGATHSGFDLFYLIQNPNPSPVQAQVRYLLPSGPPIAKTYEIAARSRFNIWVNQDDARLAATDVSAVVSTDLPVIVERAMYLSSGGISSAPATRAPGPSRRQRSGSWRKAQRAPTSTSSSSSPIRRTPMRRSGPPSCCPTAVRSPRLEP